MERKARTTAKGASAAAASDAALRLVAHALDQAHDLRPAELGQLRRLLAPRVVRSALSDFCARRWAVAVALAEAALDDARFAPELAGALGVSPREARALLRGSGRESALAVVAGLEGVTPRTIRSRADQHRWLGAVAVRFARRRLARSK